MKRVSFVTPIGFKPITAGAEIQCAIQLRHGAFFWRVVQILFSRLRHGAFNCDKINENQVFLQIDRHFSCVLMEYQINLTNLRYTFQKRICVYLHFFAF